jgi:hypothetical protein
MSEGLKVLVTGRGMVIDDAALRYGMGGKVR